MKFRPDKKENLIDFVLLGRFPILDTGNHRRETFEALDAEEKDDRGGEIVEKGCGATSCRRKRQNLQVRVHLHPHHEAVYRTTPVT